MDTNPLSLACHFDGVIDNEAKSNVYVGGKRKLKSVSRDSTFDCLLKVCYDLTKSSCIDTNLDLKYSFPGEEAIIFDLDCDEDFREMAMGTPANCRHIFVYIIKSPKDRINTNPIVAESPKSPKDHRSNPIVHETPIHASYVAGNESPLVLPDPNDRSPADIPWSGRPTRFDPDLLFLPSDPKFNCVNDTHSPNNFMSPSELYPEDSNPPDIDPPEMYDEFFEPQYIHRLQSSSSDGSGDTYGYGYDSSDGSMYSETSCKKRLSLAEEGKAEYDVPLPTFNKGKSCKKKLSFAEEEDEEESSRPIYTRKRYEEAQKLKVPKGEDGEVLKISVPRPRAVYSLSVGDLFDSKVGFQNYLKEYAMSKNFELKPVRTSPTRIIAACLIESCPWGIRALKLRNSVAFQVKMVGPDHKCGMPSRGVDHRQATHKWISEYFRSHLSKHPNCTPDELISAIQKNFGVQLTYRKALLGKKRALLEINGCWEASYKLLPSFCSELRRVDPDVVLVLEREEDNSFRRFFWSFGPAIRTFNKNLRPIISIDGTHVRGKYIGALLIATAVDGQNQIFPFAFAIVESENKYSWNWFLSILSSKVIEPGRQLVIISDRHTGLMESIPQIFPHAHHSFCVRHLVQNCIKETKESVMSDIIWPVARAYTNEAFLAAMDNVLIRCPRSYAWFTRLGSQQWARAHFPGKRYLILTTNMVESTNSVFKKARALPIIGLVTATRCKLIKYFFQRRNMGNNLTNVLTPHGEEILKAAMENARFGYVAYPSSMYLFQVSSSIHHHVVNLQLRTCTCRKFDVLGLPCAHALTAIMYRHESPYLYCEEWYTSNNYRDAYKEVMPPTLDDSQWSTGNEDLVVLPPRSRIPPGRPRKLRFKSKGEKSTNHCQKCKRKGHNVRTCRYPAVGN